jgi:hypothetical protein
MLKCLNNLPMKWTITVTEVFHTLINGLWLWWDILQTLVAGLLFTVLSKTSSLPTICRTGCTVTALKNQPFCHQYLCMHGNTEVTCLPIWALSLIFLESCHCIPITESINKMDSRTLFVSICKHFENVKSTIMHSVCDTTGDLALREAVPAQQRCQTCVKLSAHS